MPIRIGVNSCTLETPILPPAALMPSAEPFIRSGKKKEMLAIEEAKLPPPSPAVEATSSISQNGVSGWLTKQARDSVGINSPAAEKMVQLRPPKVVTANV